MSATVLGRIDWKLDRNDEGHRSYNIRWLLSTSSTSDGPTVVMNAPGLPGIGSTWAYGNDSDPWAYCTPKISVTPLISNEPNDLWIAEQTFSTRPRKRCQDQSFENPLNEPMRISGSFVKFVKEITRDRNGKVLRNAAHELLRGSIVEFDDNRPTVKIGMNVLNHPLATYSALLDHVNDNNLWGLGPRRVKFSEATFTRNVYGLCNYYYSLDFGFEVNYLTFDRKAPNEGHKCLIGHAPGSIEAPIDPDAGAPANYLNPQKFEVYKDAKGENTTCLLDNKGRPVTDEDDVVDIDIEYYEEANLLTLGIPTAL